MTKTKLHTQGINHLRERAGCTVLKLSSFLQPASWEGSSYDAMYILTWDTIRDVFRGSLQKADCLHLFQIV